MTDVFPDGDDENEHDHEHPDMGKLSDGALRLKDRIDDRMTRIGLFMRGMRLQPHPEGPHKMLVATEFQLGDTVWTKRVQKPDEHAQDESMRRQLVDMGLDEDEAPDVRSGWDNLLGDDE